MNVEGTRSLIHLARRLTHLKALVHVSTAYAHCPHSHIEEKFYTSNSDPDQVIRQCKEDVLEKAVIGEHPNTYTFTKALTEHMLQKEATDLPLVIVRPSIVVAAWKEPIPGWVDNYNGPTGMVAGAAVGLLRSMLVSRDKIADLIPVDMAINVMIVAAWHRAEGFAHVQVPIYNVTSGSQNPITWGNIEEWGMESILKYPMDTVLWYPGGSFKGVAIYDRLCRYAFHYLPAVVVDVIMILIRRPRFMQKLVNKMTQAIGMYVTSAQWKIIDS